VSNCKYGICSILPTHTGLGKPAQMPVPRIGAGVSEDHGQTEGSDEDGMKQNFWYCVDIRPTWPVETNSRQVSELKQERTQARHQEISFGWAFSLNGKLDNGFVRRTL
jgi:hypothetical protein